LIENHQNTIGKHYERQQDKNEIQRLLEENEQLWTSLAMCNTTEHVKEIFEPVSDLSSTSHGAVPNIETELVEMKRKLNTAMCHECGKKEDALKAMLATESGRRSALEAEIWALQTASQAERLRLQNEKLEEMAHQRFETTVKLTEEKIEEVGTWEAHAATLELYNNSLEEASLILSKQTVRFTVGVALSLALGRRREAWLRIGIFNWKSNEEEDSRACEMKRAVMHMMLTRVTYERSARHAMQGWLLRALARLLQVGSNERLKSRAIVCWRHAARVEETLKALGVAIEYVREYRPLPINFVIFMQMLVGEMRRMSLRTTLYKMKQAYHTSIITEARLRAVEKSEERQALSKQFREAKKDLERRLREVTSELDAEKVNTRSEEQKHARTERSMLEMRSSFEEGERRQEVDLRDEVATTERLREEILTLMTNSEQERFTYEDNVAILGKSIQERDRGLALQEEAMDALKAGGIKLKERLDEANDILKRISDERDIALDKVRDKEKEVSVLQSELKRAKKRHSLELTNAEVERTGLQKEITGEQEINADTRGQIQQLKMKIEKTEVIALLWLGSILDRWSRYGEVKVAITTWRTLIFEEVLEEKDYILLDSNRFSTQKTGPAEKVKRNDKADATEQETFQIDLKVDYRAELERRRGRHGEARPTEAPIRKKLSKPKNPKNEVVRCGSIQESVFHVLKERRGMRAKIQRHFLLHIRQGLTLFMSLRVRRAVAMMKGAYKADFLEYTIQAGQGLTPNN